jgi:HSP20 family protein
MHPLDGLLRLKAPSAATVEEVTPMTMPTRRTMHPNDDSDQWDPLAEFSRLTQQLTGLFDGRTDGSPLRGLEGFVPLADLEETDETFIVDVELPGVSKKDIAVEVVDRRLIVDGERVEKPRLGWLRRRVRSYGRFHFELMLPGQVDADRIKATLKDGVLHLEIPKAQIANHRHIEVT